MHGRLAQRSAKTAHDAGDVVVHPPASAVPAVASHHSLARLSDPPPPGAAPLQRTIRIDAMNDGEPFDVIEWVPPHFGLTARGKAVYLVWEKDAIDHHYATKADFVAAVEHAGNAPETESFRDMFVDVARTNGINIDQLEMFLNTKEATLGSLAQYSAGEIRGLLAQRGHPVQPNAAWTVRGLLDAVLAARVLTGVCGETANLVQGLLAPTTAAPPVDKDRDEVVAAVQAANATSIVRRRHQYVRVVDHGHAFIIEVANGTARLIQSFIGKYTMAANLVLDASYPVATFVALLRSALVQGPAADQQTTNARTQLFSAQAYQGSAAFAVSTFEAEPGAKARMGAALGASQTAWGAELDAPAANVLAPDVVQAPAPTGPRPLITPLFGECLYMYYPDPKVDDAHDDDFNDRMCKGTIAVPTTVRDGMGNRYRVTERTATRYRLELIVP